MSLFVCHRHPRSGGWWWARDSESSDACNSTNLNGLYGPRQGWAGVAWSGFAGSDGLTTTRMRIRPAGFEKDTYCQVACYPGQECVRDSVVDKTYSCVTTAFGGFPGEGEEGEGEGLYAMDIVIIVVLSFLTVILVTTGLDLMFMPMHKAPSDADVTTSYSDMGAYMLDTLLVEAAVSDETKETVVTLQDTVSQMAANVAETLEDIVTSPLEAMASGIWYNSATPGQPDVEHQSSEEKEIGTSSRWNSLSDSD